MIRGLSLVLAVALAGCTTELNAVRVQEKGNIPAAGAPYFLTFTQYDITVTRRVKACTPGLEVAISAKIERKEVRDPKHHYVIDFESLQSPFKISEITIEYHQTGELKSINANAEDRAGPVVTSVFTSIGKIAAVAAGVRLLRLRIDEGCKPAIQAYFVCEQPLNGEKPQAGCPTVLDALEKNTKTAAQNVEQRSAELDHLTALGATLGKAWGVSERKEHAEKLKELQNAKNALITSKDKLEAALKEISVVDKVTWPPDGETFKQDAPIVKGLTTDQICESGSSTTGQSCKWGSVDKAQYPILRANTEVWAKLEGTVPLGRTESCDDSCLENMKAGFKYRFPVPGRLSLCSPSKSDDSRKETFCSLSSSDTYTEEKIATDEGMISQLGPIFVLPLHSMPFSNKAIEATFTTTGFPTKLGIKSKVASAEGAATLAGGMVDEIIKVREAKAKNRLEEVEAETKLLKAEKDLADAKKALEPPKSDEQAEALAAFTAETALMNAELANIKARTALEEAKNLVPPTPDLPK